MGCVKPCNVVISLHEINKKPGVKPLVKLRILVFILAIGIIAIFSRLKGQSLLNPLQPEMEWEIEKSESIWVGNHAIVIDASDRSITVINEAQDIVLATPKGHGFIGASFDQVTIKESYGSFRMKYGVFKPCEKLVVKSVSSTNEVANLSGYFECHRQQYSWVMSFQSNDNPQGIQIQFETDPKLSRINIHLQSNKEEVIWGGGAQFTHFNLKNYKIPIWVSEQGIGRGQQPLTSTMDLLALSGGSEFTTYFPAASFITSRWRGFFTDETSLGHWDFRNPSQITLDYWSHKLKFFAHRKDSPQTLMADQTVLIGRQPPLPDWAHQGAILGLQGGTQEVLNKWESLRDQGASVKGVWIQDWVGQRRTAIGQQLWWDWQLDESLYKDFEVLSSHLKDNDIKLLGYINPMLVDRPSGATYLQHAKENNFLLKKSDGSLLKVNITSFDAYLVNLFNPQAFQWLKKIILTELVEKEFSGWMADFGESFPGFWPSPPQNSTASHNSYAEAWAKLNSEVIAEYAPKKELLAFHRSGFTKSPQFTQLYWLGDQLPDWSPEDGMRSTLTALLSSGASGVAYTHSDIGGYTSIALPFLKKQRSEELLQRWIEMNAFTPVFRTHEGNKPKESLQVYTNEKLQKHFSKFSQIFTALFPYRKSLSESYQESGMPLMRPYWMEYPNEKLTLTIDDFYFLGSDLLVAPVFQPGQTAVSVLVPNGNWFHLFTGKEFKYELATWESISSEVGKPAVLIRADSIWADQLKQAIADIEDNNWQKQ